MAGKIILKSLEEQDTSIEVASGGDHNSFENNIVGDSEESSEVCWGATIICSGGI